MIARIVLVASLVAFAIVTLASHTEAAPSPELRHGAVEAPPAGESRERPACRVVKVVYAGHGEAERAACRPAL